MGFGLSQGTIPTISRLVLERAFFLEKLMILVGPVGKPGDLLVSKVIGLICLAVAVPVLALSKVSHRHFTQTRW